MIYILLGILGLVLAHVLVMPYALYLVIVIVSAVAIIYGIWLLLAGFRGPPGATPRSRRVWY